MDNTDRADENFSYFWTGFGFGLIASAIAVFCVVRFI